MTQQDTPGQPETTATPDGEASEQTLSLSTKQAAQQLGYDDRTVRRFITDGRLPARQIRTKRGTEYQVYQSDLDAFIAQRDQAATEGQAAQQLIRAAAEESHALQIIAAELESRSAALVEAQATIERLAREAGREAGRSEELQRQLDRERQRVQALEAELEAERKKQPRRIHLLRWPNS